MCITKLCATHFTAVTIIGSHLTDEELRAREGNPVVQRHAATKGRSQDWNPAGGDEGHVGFLFLSL